jgi:hypothetical protein
MNWKKVFYHAFYVGGMAMSGALTVGMTDGGINSTDIYYALMSAIVTSLGGFFIAFGVESKQNGEDSEIHKLRARLNKIEGQKRMHNCKLTISPWLARAGKYVFLW